MFKILNSSIVRLLNFIVLSVITLGLLLFSFVIGMNSYQQITRDLSIKAEGISKVAAIALQEPIWNFDTQAMNGVVDAILLDRDVVGIEVRPAEAGESLRTQFNGPVEGLTLEAITARQVELGILINQADIHKEGKSIGSVSIITSAAVAREQIKQTTILIASFAAVFIVIMGALFWASARKFVATPLKTLENSADQLAHGNLDYPIDTGRIDEIGALATRFSEMRDAIRKKIDDLHVLNTTGEELAGIHDQSLALETVLKVMNEQNHLECGSIYLLKGDELVISAFYPHNLEDALATNLSPRSFALGEGIAGQAALQGKTLFVANTSHAPDYVADLPGVAPKALLCVPMMDDQNVFGVMNFSGNVDKVRFLPEDEEFALTLARMTVVTTKNIQMLNVIEEQNRTLEQKVLERTAQLRQKTNDINSMLQNMQQGIFTITPNGTIHPEYSAFLTRILDTEHIANQPFMQVLLGRALLGSDQLSQVETAVLAILGEDAMMFEFNSHLLAKEFNITVDSGATKILDVDWSPIVDDNGVVEKLMVTVRDITELRGLQQEAESQRQELEIIGQILSVNQQKFSEFVSTSQTYLAENEKLINATADKDIDVLATLFRNMHTIKGNARTYGFKYLTDAVHEAEHTYDELRKRQEIDWDKEQLLNELHKAERFVEKYKHVYESKLSRFNDPSQGKFVEHTLLDRMNSVVNTADMKDGEQLQATVKAITRLLQAIDTTPLPKVLEGILQALPALALELGKEPPTVNIDEGGIRLNSDIAPVIKDVFMHVFRNAMDHGLEAAAEREAKGKPAAGTIQLHTVLMGDKLIIDFRDDGRGLALSRIRKKAQEAGLLDPQKACTDAEVAEFIFHSGLSTAQEVSDISGRGVGMDAVRRFLIQNGGSISLQFVNDADAGQDYRAFALQIHLPAQFALQV